LEKLEDGAKEICVDTDVLIDFLKEKNLGADAYEVWRNRSLVSITSITAFELLLGARHPNMGARRYEEAKNLIEQQNQVFPF